MIATDPPPGHGSRRYSAATRIAPETNADTDAQTNAERSGRARRSTRRPPSAARARDRAAGHARHGCIRGDFAPADLRAAEPSSRRHRGTRGLAATQVGLCGERPRLCACRRLLRTQARIAPMETLHTAETGDGPGVEQPLAPRARPARRLRTDPSRRGERGVVMRRRFPGSAWPPFGRATGDFFQRTGVVLSEDSGTFSTGSA